MGKLLSANFSRLFHSKVYWLGMFFMFGFALFAVCARFHDTITMPDYPYATVDGLWFVGGIYLSVVLAVFISIWIGTEYSDKTMRNKIIVGHARGTIYCSNWITCMIASLMMHLVYIAVIAGLGAVLLGRPETPGKVLALSILASLLTVMALSSIFLLIAMLIDSKSTGVVVSMILALLIIFGSMIVFNRLAAPEYYESSYEMVVDGQVIEGEPELNPRYLEGTKREVYQFVLDAVPGGQMLQYGDMSLPGNIARFPFYSSLIILLTSGFGWICFRRKDLK